MPDNNPKHKSSAINNHLETQKQHPYIWWDTIINIIRMYQKIYNDIMLNIILNSVCTHLLNKSSQKKISKHEFIENIQSSIFLMCLQLKMHMNKKTKNKNKIPQCYEFWPGDWKRIGKSISKSETKWMLDERQGQPCMHPYMQFNISPFFTSPHPPTKQPDYLL